MNICFLYYLMENKIIDVLFHYFIQVQSMELEVINTVVVYILQW